MICFYAFKNQTAPPHSTIEQVGLFLRGFFFERDSVYAEGIVTNIFAVSPSVGISTEPEQVSLIGSLLPKLPLYLQKNLTRGKRKM